MEEKNKPALPLLPCQLLTSDPKHQSLLLYCPDPEHFATFKGRSLCLISC